MRSLCSLLGAFAFVLLGVVAGISPVAAQSSAGQSPAVDAERIKSASALKPGYGAVVISIRSELYLEEPLDVYFLREGGDVANRNDVISFGRKQSFFAFGNSTVEYQVRAYALPAGTYRLAGHGIQCPKIPAEDERCLIDQPGLLGSVEVSRPSRGYGEVAPTFEVRSGQVTYAGDFGLTARNVIEWSVIPAKELSRIRRGFARLPRAPEPMIPDGFALKYGLNPRSFEDDRGRRY